MRPIIIFLGPIVAIALLGIVFDGDPMRPAAAALLVSMVVNIGCGFLPGPQRVNLAGQVLQLAPAPVWSVLAIAAGALCLIGVYIACALWASGVLS